MLTSGADLVVEAEPSEAVEQAEDTLEEAAADEESSETLDIPLADLRPALEAVLMVADQPLDHMTLASAVGYPPGEVAAALHGAGRGVRRAGPRLRPAQRRGRLALLHPRGVRLGRRAVRARRAAGPAHPGRPGDARRGRLQAAGQPGPGLGDPRRERRRRDAHAGGPRPGRGGRARRGDHRDALPHDRATSWSGSAWSRSTTCPSWRRSCRRWATSRTWTPDRAGRGGRRAPREPRRPTGIETDDEGLIRLQKLLAQSGVASRRKCEELMLAGLVEVDGEVVTRLGTKVDPTTAVIRVDGKRLPPVSPHVYLVLNKPRGVVSTMSDPEGRRDARRVRRRPARAAVPRRPARHRHRGPDPADQRRRLRAAGRAPVVRAGQDVRRRGRRRGREGHGPAAAGRRHARGRAGRGAARRRSSRPSAGPVDRRAGHPRGPQPDRAPAARRGRPPGAPADPHRDRPGAAARPAARGELRELTLDELGVLLDAAKL